METTRVLPRGSKNTSVLGKIYSECKIFSSIIFILDKLESDGYFERINECLQFIFNKEMAFAVFELKKIKSRKKKFDIKNQLVNNTFIFKENLKIITGSLIDTLWNEKVRSEKIQQTIQKAQQEINKGTFEEILELGEEEENYLSSDVVSKRETSRREKFPEIEEDFAHSYETDLESKEFKFGSGEAKKRKGAGEGKVYQLEEIPEKNSKGAEAGVENLVLERKDFGTFGNVTSKSFKKFEKKTKTKRQIVEKKENQDWKTDFEKERKNQKEHSIDEEITKMNTKEIIECQSNTWEIKGWDHKSNGEKPRTSASMGSLILKSTKKGNSPQKKVKKIKPKNSRERTLSQNKKEKWKRPSGLNMYLLSRKNGSSKGSSMRSVSKSGSFKVENSNVAKSESLKRKRENRGWGKEKMKARPLPKRTLADRLTGQKLRQIKGIRKNSKNFGKYPKSQRGKKNISKTPEMNLKKHGQRVSSLTKLKRLKNHLLTEKKNKLDESLQEEKTSKRGREKIRKSPHQILKKLISGFEKPPRLEIKNSAKVIYFQLIVFIKNLNW